MIQPKDGRETLTKIDRSGCYVLLGLPVLILGLTILIGGVRAQPGVWALGLALGLGGLLTFLGAHLLFARRGFRIDRDARTVEKWWGLWAPMKRRRYALDRFDYVCVREDHVTTRPGLFVVELCGREGRVPLASEIDDIDALELGREVADFADLDFEDRTDWD